MTGERDDVGSRIVITQQFEGFAGQWFATPAEIVQSLLPGCHGAHLLPDLRILSIVLSVIIARPTRDG